MVVHRPYRHVGRDRQRPRGTRVDEAADGGGGADRIAAGEDDAVRRAGMVGRRTPVGGDQRQAARPRLGGDEAEGFRLRPVDQRVGARHEARHFAAVGCPLGEVDVRVARHRPADLARIASRADDDQPDRPMVRRAHHRLDDHPPAFLRRVTADAEEQRRVRAEAAPRQQLGAQPLVAQRRREDVRVDSHRIGDDVGQTTGGEALGQAGARADDHAELRIKTEQVAPVPVEPPVDHRRRGEPLEPAIGEGGERIAVHEQRPRHGPGPRPARDHGRAAPRRRRLEHVRRGGGDRGVQHRLVGEIAVVAVEREQRVFQPDDPRVRSARLGPVRRPRRDDRHVVAHRRAGGELAVDIGPHPPAGRRVEGTDVDDSHAADFMPVTISDDPIVV